MCAVIEALGFFLAPSTDMIAAPASAPRGAGHAHASRGKPGSDADFAQFLASTASPAASPQDDGEQDSKIQVRPSSAAPSQDDAARKDDKVAGKPDKVVAVQKNDKHGHKLDGEKKDTTDASPATQISVAAAPTPPVASTTPLPASDTDTAVLALSDTAVGIAGDGKAKDAADPGQAIPDGDKSASGKAGSDDGKIKPDHSQPLIAATPTGIEASVAQAAVSTPAATARKDIASPAPVPLQQTANAAVPAQPPASGDTTAITAAVAKPVAGKPANVVLETTEAPEDLPVESLAALQAAPATAKPDTKDSTPKKASAASVTSAAFSIAGGPAPTSGAPSPAIASDDKSGVKDVATASRTAAPAADAAKPSHNATPEAAAPQPQAQVPAAATAPVPNPSLIAGGIPFAAPTANAGAPMPATSLHIANAPAEAAPDLDALAVSVAARAMGGARQFEIRLDPPELGRVDVRLSIDASGKTQAHMTADQPQTLDLLQKDAPTLTQALRDAGLDVSQGGLNFSLRGQDRQANDGGQGMPGRRTNLSVSRVIGAVQAQAAISAGGAAADARLDIHV